MFKLRWHVNMTNRDEEPRHSPFRSCDLSLTCCWQGNSYFPFDLIMCKTQAFAWDWNATRKNNTYCAQIFRAFCPNLWMQFKALWPWHILLICHAGLRCHRDKAAVKLLPGSLGHSSEVASVVLPRQWTIRIKDPHEMHSAYINFIWNSRSDRLWNFKSNSSESLWSASAWATGSTCAWNKKHQQVSKWSPLTTCSNCGGTSHGKWEQLTKTFPFSLFTALIPASLAAGWATPTSLSTWSCAKPKLLLGTGMQQERTTLTMLRSLEHFVKTCG